MDTTYSKARGGRWNPPEAFGILYLNRDVPMARQQVHHKLAGQPYGVEDLDEQEQHDLVEVEVPERAWLDCITGAGLRAVGLPRSYPFHPGGDRVPHAVCQPAGQAAYDAGYPGLACRSAASTAAPGDEELGVFDREATIVRMTGRVPFADWFWP